jgi:Pyruvate/2-oxoacid:ferredoxin oxidoreductase delta subunit
MILKSLYIKRKKHISLKPYIKDDTVLLNSDSDSPVGNEVPLVVMEYSKPGNLHKMILPVLPKLIRSISLAMKSYRDIKKNKTSDKTIINSKYINKLEDYAISIGCRQIGYAKVENWMIFKGKSVLFSNAIVVTIDMNKEAISAAPGVRTLKEVFRTYQDLGYIVNKLADFIRKSDFQAQAGPALGGDLIYPALAEAAGLGATGLHGLLISPEAGSSQRIAAVYTNIENLPFSENNPHLWVKEFCKICKKCVKRCPGYAIYSEQIRTGTKTESHIDMEKCAVHFANEFGCSVCIKECTFTDKSYSMIKSGFVK